jgi:hypothetical protein
MPGAIPPLSQYVFMTRCLVKHRDFTFTLTLLLPGAETRSFSKGRKREKKNDVRKTCFPTTVVPESHVDNSINSTHVYHRHVQL